MNSRSWLRVCAPVVAVLMAALLVVGGTAASAGTAAVPAAVSAAAAVFPTTDLLSAAALGAPAPTSYGTCPVGVNCGPLPYFNGVYAATPTQRSSLRALQAVATADVIHDHALAGGDAAAVQSWARPDADAQLWALLVNAIDAVHAGQATADQVNAATWLAAVLQRETVVTAQGAGLEYTKWAGLGVQVYQDLLLTNPTQAQLTSFLGGTPEPYTHGGSATNSAASTDGGYCVYRSPAPLQGDYTSNIFTSFSAPQSCFTACTSLLGCLPPTPTFNQFSSWGAAQANNGLLSGFGSPAAVRSIAVGGALAATATVGAVGAGLVTAQALGSTLSGSAFQTAVFPYSTRVTQLAVSAAQTAAEAAGEDGAAAVQEVVEAAEVSGGEIAASGVGVIVSAVIFALSTAIQQGLTVITAAAVPGQLASMTAQAEAATPDLYAALAANPSGLFAIFAGAVLPQPRFSSCDNSLAVTGFGPLTAPCLNPTAVPAAAGNDPQWVLTPSGSSTSTTQATLQLTDASTGLTSTQSLHGNWIITTATVNGISASAMSLRLHYSDWSGAGHTAFVFANQSPAQFLTVADSAFDSTFDPTTCVTTGVCSLTPTIQVVGADGTDENVSVTGGAEAPPLPPCTAADLCAAQHTVTTTSVSGPTTVAVGQPASYAAIVTGSAGVTGTVTFESGSGPACPASGLHDPIAPSGLVDYQEADCTVTFTSPGTYYLFATYSGDSSFIPSQGEVTVTVPPPSAPGAPTIGTATPGVFSASVSFTAPASNGGSAITRYTVTADDHTNAANGGQVASGVGSPITVTGLANGDHYSFSVTATNSLGTGPPSSSTDATTLTTPGAPIMGAVSPGPGSASVSFQPPHSDGGSPITNYNVTALDLNNPANGGQNVVGTVSPILVTGLTNGDNYTFTVTATTNINMGPASTASAIVTPAGPPGAPTIGVATVAAGAATVSFTAPASTGGRAITGYTVTAVDHTSDANGGQTATGTLSPITVTGLSNGDTYSFTVTATNTVGTGPASSATDPVITPTTPGTPTIGVATPGPDSAAITFTAPVRNGGSPITTYTVTATDHTSPANGGQTATGITSPITVVGLSNGDTYSFTVTATNTIGTGPASSATTPVTIVPGPTTALALTPGTSATIPAGGIQAFTATGADINGNSTGGVTAHTTFAIAPTAGGGGAAAGASCTPNTCTATTAGGYTVTAVDGTATATATLTVTAGPAATVSPASGGQQTATVGAPFTSPLVAHVTDVYGNPVPGTPVTFTLPPLSATTGAATFPGATTTVTVTSNAAGTATSAVITATQPGPVTATATTAAAIGATYPLAVTATGPARADLAVTLTAPTQAHPGATATVTVTVTVTDNGPSTATKVVAAITTPAGWTVTNPGGGTSLYHQAVLFIVPALATKTSVTYTVIYTVDRHPSTARITAFAFSSTQDPNRHNNITTSSIQIR